MDKIPLGTFQRTGDNMLPLILKLVNSKQISDVEKYSTGNLVIPFFFKIYTLTVKLLLLLYLCCCFRYFLISWVFLLFIGVKYYLI